MELKEFTTLRYQGYRPDHMVVLSLVGPVQVQNTAIPLVLLPEASLFRDLEVLVLHVGNRTRFAILLMERLAPVVKSLEYENIWTGEVLAIVCNHVKALTFIPRHARLR